jgi:hypothetical protein
MYLPLELVRIIISYARPLRPYIHELKYFFIYHKDPQITIEYSQVEYHLEEDDEYDYESIITEYTIFVYKCPVYNKGYLHQLNQLTYYQLNHNSEYWDNYYDSLL